MLLELMHDVAEINPLLILFAIAALYAFALLLRAHFGRMLVLGWTAYCASMVLLPGGRAVVEQSQRIEIIPNKIACIGEATIELAPWGKARDARKVSACRVEGSGFGPVANRKLGTELLEDNGRRLKQRFGD